MSILPTFADMIDYSSMKHSIIPRITELCVKSSSESVSIVISTSLGLLCTLYIVYVSVLICLLFLKNERLNVIVTCTVIVTLVFQCVRNR